MSKSATTLDLDGFECLAAVEPVVWLEATRDCVDRAASQGSRTNFRWRSRCASGLDFIPVGTSGPRLVKIGAGTALRFGKDGPGDSGNGALIQASDRGGLPRDYTLAVVFRIPVPPTSRTDGYSGGALVGNPPTSSFAFSSVQTGDGRLDHRHRLGSASGIVHSTDFRDGAPHLVVWTYSTQTGTLSLRIDGRAVARSPYAEPYSRAKTARMILIGGASSGASRAPLVGDVAAVFLSNGPLGDRDLSILERRFGALRDRMARHD